MSNHNRLDAHTALAEARETVRRVDFRRAIGCGVVALAAPGVYYELGGLAAHGGQRIVVFVSIGACFVFGLVAVRSTANEVARLVGLSGGVSAANVLRWVITLAGYIVVAAEVITLFGVPIDRLLLSGAITGVVVGIAAQQSLGNAFAGLVLLFSRPFVVGEHVTVRSGALGGQYDGEVTAITLMYTRLLTEDGPITLPNSGVLNSATGPRAAPPPEVEPEPVVRPRLRLVPTVPLGAHRRRRAG
ncbi:MAG TPA: mechanosensitive ion channel family protein [Pseudonocardiaceae bacterium]|nr:mechanosensitive ion channel family protein [Pseudonocardiaceae bacterium]